MLSWTSPSRPNGKIGYFLSYWKFQGSSQRRADLKSVRLPGEITRKEVNGLKPYSEYKFEIVAYNLKKNSNASTPNIAVANTTAEGTYTSFLFCFSFFFVLLSISFVLEPYEPPVFTS